VIKKINAVKIFNANLSHKNDKIQYKPQDNRTFTTLMNQHLLSEFLVVALLSISQN